MKEIRTLVIDDSSELRDLISTIIDLRSDGWVVVGTAGDGAAAVEEAKRTQPDVILLDIAMPVMDGLQALPRIREVAPDACVVMLSGFPSKSGWPTAQALGADGYLEKSDLADTLIPQVAEVLRSRTPSRADG